MHLATIKVLKCDMCGDVGTVQWGVGPRAWHEGYWHFCPNCKDTDTARVLTGEPCEPEGLSKKEKIEYVTEFH